MMTPVQLMDDPLHIPQKHSSICSDMWIFQVPFPVRTTNPIQIPQNPNIDAENYSSWEVTAALPPATTMYDDVFFTTQNP